MCVFNGTSCTLQEFLLLGATVLILGVLIGALVISVLIKKQKETPILDNQPLENAGEGGIDPKNEWEEKRYPPIKVGQKILYDICGGYECNLVVTKVDEDESEVKGFFEIGIPDYTDVLALHYDYDNDNITCAFKAAGGVVKELIFNIEDPDELDGYDIYIDCVTTVIKQ